MQSTQGFFWPWVNCSQLPVSVNQCTVSDLLTSGGHAHISLHVILHPTKHVRSELVEMSPSVRGLHWVWLAFPSVQPSTRLYIWSFSGLEDKQYLPVFLFNEKLRWDVAFTVHWTHNSLIIMVSIVSIFYLLKLPFSLLHGLDDDVNVECKPVSVCAAHTHTHINSISV